MASWWCPEVRRLLLMLVLLLGCAWMSQAARVAHVVLVPLPEVSHCREMVSIGRELHARGHKVVLFVPDYFKVRRCTEPAPLDGEDLEVRVFITDVYTATKIGDHLEKMAEEQSRGAAVLSVRDIMGEVCRSYVEGKRDVDMLRRQKVDFMLVDGSQIAHCLTLLPAYLGVPFAAVTSFFSPTDCGMPLPASYYPHPMSALPGNMGLVGRVRNFFHYVLVGMTDAFLGPSFHQGEALGKRLFYADYNNLIKKAALYLENSDYVVDYPKATFPNFVQVGGLTAAPARPLPGPLRKFFDEAGEKGVVVVSFGSHLLTPPPLLEEKLLNAFRKVDARVLLRLNTTAVMKKFRNIQVASWFPQNDAIGHPSTRLLVSHCGKNSFFEALYHAVPILCTPFYSDTVGTAVRVTEFGVGLSLDLNIVSAETIAYTVNTLLKEKSYHKRMNAASALFHSRPGTPAERAADAIEHVIQYGGSQTRPRSVDMGFFQYSGLDIALVVFLMVIGITVVLFAAYRYIPAYLQARREASTEHEAAGSSKVLVCVFIAFIAAFYIFL